MHTHAEHNTGGKQESIWQTGSINQDGEFAVQSSSCMCVHLKFAAMFMRNTIDLSMSEYTGGQSVHWDAVNVINAL